MKAGWTVLYRIRTFHDGIDDHIAGWIRIGSVDAFEYDTPDGGQLYVQKNNNSEIKVKQGIIVWWGIDFKGYLFSCKTFKQSHVRCLNPGHDQISLDSLISA